jgi:hypothetical protein
VVATLASAFIPGLGQFLQGRYVAAGSQFLAVSLLWFVFEHGGAGFAGHWAVHLHWLVHLYSAIDAAVYRRDLALRAGR